MPFARLLPLVLLIGASADTAVADATRSTGPVFEAFGPVFEGVEPEYMPPTDRYRAIFDVWKGPDDAATPNARLATLARFMNYNARAGIAPEQISLALVLHGSAGRAALRDASYRERFGVDNPDLALLEALTARGVRILYCGQSAAARGYARDEMIAPVEMAVSAYTAILGLQEEGYRMMPSWE
jgi:intracellular sulfur oxidation DsrE/DsrF family protein